MSAIIAALLEKSIETTCSLPVHIKSIKRGCLLYISQVSSLFLCEPIAQSRLPRMDAEEYLERRDVKLYRQLIIEYVDMKEEVKDLRRRIEADKRAIDRLDKMTVADTVTCGKKGKRALKVVKTEGFPAVEYERRKALLRRRIAKLEMMETDFLEEQIKVEEYIEQIPKSELRVMFRLYFLDDLSYPKVALKMNDIYPHRKIAFSDENVKKRMQRYFQSVQQCPDPGC